MNEPTVNVTQSLMREGTFWFPKAVSTYAHSVDSLYYFIYWASVVLFIGILGAMGYFLVKYRRRSKDQLAEAQITHNDRLELTWTILPLILVMGIFYFGYRGYMDMAVSPVGSMEIQVVGKKWFWQFEYPKEGVQTLNELVVPLNQPVKLIMNSEDVIHSFYVPNFRIKRDVLPNHFSVIWFEATEVGTYQIFCTEYCGDGHSEMLAVLRVLPQDEYEDWLKQAASGGDDLPLEVLGERLYTSKACVTCHSIDGTSKVGPSWLGIFGANRPLVGGGSAVADENYLREAIVEPGAKIVAGYQPVMPTYAGLLSDREINAIIEYIKGLK